MTSIDIDRVLTTEMKKMRNWPRSYLKDFPVRNQLGELGLAVGQLRELMDRARDLGRSGQGIKGSAGMMLSLIALVFTLGATVGAASVHNWVVIGLGLAILAIMFLILWERSYTVPTAVAYECRVAIYEDELRLRERDEDLHR
jgi:hypothetical protein